MKNAEGKSCKTCKHCHATIAGATRAVPLFQEGWDYYSASCSVCGTKWSYAIDKKGKYKIPIENRKAPILLGSLKQMPSFWQEVEEEHEREIARNKSQGEAA